MRLLRGFALVGMGVFSVAACASSTTVFAQSGGRLSQAAKERAPTQLSTTFASSGVTLTHDQSWRHYPPTDLASGLPGTDGYLSTVAPSCLSAQKCATPLPIPALGPSDVLVAVSSQFITASAGGSGGTDATGSRTTIDGYTGTLVHVAPTACPAGAQVATVLDLAIPNSKPDTVKVTVCSGGHANDAAVSTMIRSMQIVAHELPFSLPQPHDFGPAVSRTVQDVVIEASIRTDKPTLSWEQAVTACRQQSCDPVNAEVTLGRATTANPGAHLAEGGIEPELDHRLVYILDWPGETCLPNGTSVPPNSYSSTGGCERFALLDANSGQILFTFSRHG